MAKGKVTIIGTFSEEQSISLSEFITSEIDAALEKQKEQFQAELESAVKDAVKKAVGSLKGGLPSNDKPKPKPNPDFKPEYDEHIFIDSRVIDEKTGKPFKEKKANRVMVKATKENEHHVSHNERMGKKWDEPWEMEAPQATFLIRKGMAVYVGPVEK